MASLFKRSNLQSLTHCMCWVPPLWQTIRDRGAFGAATIGSPLGELDAPRLRTAVQKMYGSVAVDPGGKFHFNRGAEYAATLLGYDRAELAAIPASSTASFAGVGNPHVIDPLREGEVVLDVGSGAGTDLLLAARHVGSTGHAIGVDLTEEMVQRCQASISQSGLQNVEVRLGDAENLPVADTTVDAVISNGVLNLVPDKERAFREIFRVLRPGGRLMLGDIVLSTRLGRILRHSIDLWTLCVGGALRENELIELVTGAGFERVRVTQRYDCVRGTSDELVARVLGVHGINLYAAKPSQAGDLSVGHEDGG